MPLFAVIGLDHPPHAMAKRDAVRTDHGSYVTSNDEAILQVGVLLDDEGAQCGTIYLFEATSQDQIRSWLAQEPFVRQGVYFDLIIRRLKLGLNWLPLQEWPGRT